MNNKIIRRKKNHKKNIFFKKLNICEIESLVVVHGVKKI